MVQQHGHRAANSIRLSTKQAPRARSFSPACVKAGLVDIGGVHEYAVPQKEWTGFGDAIIFFGRRSRCDRNPRQHITGFVLDIFVTFYMH